MDTIGSKTKIETVWLRCREGFSVDSRAFFLHHGMQPRCQGRAGQVAGQGRAGQVAGQGRSGGRTGQVRWQVRCQDRWQGRVGQAACLITCRV